MNFKKIYSLSSVFTVLLISLVFYFESTLAPTNDSKNFEELIDLEYVIHDIYLQMGYGGFIHKFKNYVLRGDEYYLKRTLEQYQKIKQDIAFLEKNLPDNFSKEMKNNIKTIRSTVDEYHSKLDLIKELHNQGKSIPEIDSLIKINDKPAIKATNNLLEQVHNDQEAFYYQTTLTKYNRGIQALILLVVLFLIFFGTLMYHIHISANALNESEKFYSNLLETIDQPVFVFDNKLNTLHTNIHGENLKLVLCSESTPEEKNWSLLNLFSYNEEFKQSLKEVLEKRENHTFNKKLPIGEYDIPFEISVFHSPAITIDRYKYGIMMLKDLSDIVVKNEVREVHHRVKNSFALFYGLVDMIKRDYSGNIEVSNVITAIQSKMNALSSLYYNDQSIGKKDSNDMASYINHLTTNIQSLCQTHLQFNVNIDDRVVIKSKEAIALGLIMNEFIMNSVKHAKTGRILEIDINIELADNEAFTMSIKDNGTEEPEFLKSNNGLGFEIVQILSMQLNKKEKYSFEDGLKLTLS